MFDTFLKIDGIPGESTDDAHKEWIEVLDFDHEMTQPASATVSSAGG
ncbi:MAG: type VI secretion system tube protein Hcp, partial [Bryobacteraceae bacterium]